MAEMDLSQLDLGCSTCINRQFTPEEMAKLQALTVPVPQRELERIIILREANLLDTADEESYDRYTSLVKRYFHTPIALISLVDISRQWFKSKVGLDATQTHRDYAFCAYAVLEDAPDVFIVPNALEDDRFRENPLVTGHPNIRFYAGTAIKVQGVKLGTLCIIDTNPRHDFGLEQQQILIDIAALVSNLIEERRSKALKVEQELARITMSVLYSIKRPLDSLRVMQRDMEMQWKDLQQKKMLQVENGSASPVITSQESKLMAENVYALQEKLEVLQALLELSLTVTSRLLSIESRHDQPKLMMCNIRELMKDVEIMVQRLYPNCTLNFGNQFTNTSTGSEHHAEDFLYYTHPDLICVLLISMLSLLHCEQSQLRSVSIESEEKEAAVYQSSKLISRIFDGCEKKNTACSSKKQSSNQSRSHSLVITNSQRNSGLFVSKGNLIFSLVAIGDKANQNNEEIMGFSEILKYSGGTIEVSQSFGLAQYFIRIPYMKASPNAPSAHLTEMISRTSSMEDEYFNGIRKEQAQPHQTRKFLFGMFTVPSSFMKKNKVYIDDGHHDNPEDHYQDEAIMSNTPHASTHHTPINMSHDGSVLGHMLEAVVQNIQHLRRSINNQNTPSDVPNTAAPMASRNNLIKRSFHLPQYLASPAQANTPTSKQERSQ